MAEFARICVFCGSRAGVRDDYRRSAEALGRRLAERGIELVYGGGKVGLMGVVADACLTAGGRVTGVIPDALMKWEVGHAGLSRLEVVDSMHARKARMAELSDGFIALPGGLGTFEELFEILTWAQLGFHRKPAALLDVGEYYRPMVTMLDAAVREGFMKPENRSLLLHGREPDELLQAMTDYRGSETSRVIHDERQL
ncbi:MAG: TIGR00730 family Rossman fold protein [Rhodocyclaceae bacterium]|nr:TIGR00730 family Rossman fold protein [Rhodocyclaceae bacterium]